MLVLEEEKALYLKSSVLILTKKFCHSIVARLYYLFMSMQIVIIFFVPILNLRLFTILNH